MQSALQVLWGRFCHLCGLCLLLLLESCSFALYSGTLNQLSHFSTRVLQLSPSCRTALNKLPAVTLLYSCKQLYPGCRSSLSQLSAVTLLYSCKTEVSRLPLFSEPAVSCHTSLHLSNSSLPADALLLKSCQLSHFFTCVLQLSPSCRSALNQLSAVTFLYSAFFWTALSQLPLCY